jgi:hypothetical protein
MTKWLRWVALVPASAAAFIAVLMLLWPLHTLLMYLCPASEIFDEGTTDLAKPDYAAIGQDCAAAWFPGAETAVSVGVLAAAIAAAGCVAAWLAPAGKAVSAFCASCLALCLTYTVFRLSQ